MRSKRRRERSRKRNISPPASFAVSPLVRGGHFYLAAAAALIAAAVVAVVAAAVAAPGAAAVAQQEDQDDDPANVTAAETVIITHKHYLRKNLQRHQPLIPRYSGGSIWCEKAGACMGRYKTVNPPVNDSQEDFCYSLAREALQRCFTDNVLQLPRHPHRLCLCA